MKLFQKLINLLNLFKLTQIKFLLNGKEIDLTGEDINIKSDTLAIDSSGRMILTGDDTTPAFTVKDNIKKITISPSRVRLMYGTRTAGWLSIDSNGKGSLQLPNDGYANFYGIGSGTEIDSEGITTPQLTQTSKESKKKNITKYNEKALEIVKNSEIYEYNFKSENDNDKKHIGFVIGDEGGIYRTPEQVISNDREGIESYSMTSILWKAFQEYIAEKDEQIKQLQKEIENLKKESE